jgi:gas vesicle protein
MTYFLSALIGAIIGFISAALLAANKDEEPTYLNHLTEDDFDEQL